MIGQFELFIFFNLLLCIGGMKLSQVFILSRHNIRAPLTANLEHFSPYPWPIWSEEAGHLTKKGALLEEYIGEYISDWLKKENLLDKGCPGSDSVHIYANTRHRTRESAYAFVRGAFRNCNVTVRVINSENMDPIFNPIIHSDSKELKSTIISEMQQQLDDLQLSDAYLELEKIVDLKNSLICKNQNLCSFVNENEDIVYEVGKEPNIEGPLAYGNNIVDSFLMSYYEGMALSDVAWGKIKSSDQWKSLAKITKENQNIRFNSTILAKEVAKPLLNYVKELFEKDKPPKFILLQGHDANLNSVTSAIGVNGYVLPDQYEITPIGGKLVIQKWLDEEVNQYFLKVDFVYLTTDQLRSGTKFSKENSPRWVKLEMKACTITQNGYCLWDDFMKILKLI